MNKTNEFVLKRENYKSYEEFERALGRIVLSLIESDYIMTVRYDEPGLGIVAIDYNYSDREFGNDYPYWLSEDEFYSVYTDEERERDRGLQNM